MDRVAIKAKAKEFAYKNKWNIWAPTLIVVGITLGVSYVLGIFEVIAATILKSNNFIYYIAQLLEFALGLGVMPLSVGFAAYMLKLIRKGKAPEVGEIFRFYRKDCIWKIILVALIAELIIFGLSLLLVIPGIIWAIKYAMMVYVMAEQYDKEVTEEPEKAYKVSERMMDGHKWEYVVLQLSFIGWFILCELTLGILLIWIYPYYITANTMWFEELKKISK